MKSKALALLSGEGTSIPESEARALFQTYDPGSEFLVPEPRVLLVETEANPFTIASRVAFSRRVGVRLSDPLDAAETVAGKKVRVRVYTIRRGEAPPTPGEILEGLDVRVDLMDPDYEFTVVRGRNLYVALTSPIAMRQGWSGRRPRKRPFFHPSAIFPKLSRALVNMSGCKEGEVFLDPFAGTGSLVIEAYEIGARPVALDISGSMVRGAIRNMRRFGQEWLGAVRCDSFNMPVSFVQAVATDVPYGRASSTLGRSTEEIVKRTLVACSSVMSEGSRMVLMHPSTVPVEPTSDWVTVEELQLHVHKRLTRTISVLKRT